MSSNCLKVTIEKNWCSQNFDFVSLKNLSPDQFLESSNFHRYFERNYHVLKSKSAFILLEKNINFKKNETKSKWKIPHTVLERQTLTLCFSSYNNHKLKVELQWVGAPDSKKRKFFVPFILSEGNACISKNITPYPFCLLLKLSKPFSVSLRTPRTIISI